MLKLSFYNKLIVGLQIAIDYESRRLLHSVFFYLLQWQQWRITIFRALGRDKLRGCGPNCYTIKTKKYFQPKLYIEPNEPVYAALQRHES